MSNPNDPSSNWRIVIELENVTEIDVQSIAQEAWDKWAEEMDAIKDEFAIHITHNGIITDWKPEV